ncbi:hypothetical protein BCU94_18495 [Shewanella sp. 10N.286.52.C2]|uniref:hypothetical protein n=1 Tax=Shewanella sp. 10N.286.52.C2 TaxID=1880838 RepID=UPI000C85C9C3|nr:hypothetical protein [Shewanella sp. 10N.286.52.C2]PMG28020.1 hypothetical protein BCU94_18495 [Shewanella sp. 10N.286.52.C2]
MSSHIGWSHPVESGGQWDGFNDSGIETFKGNPIVSLGREITQNSRDSVLDEKLPVRIEFNLFDLDVATIPDIQGLRNNISVCQEFAKNSGARAEQFFNDATKLLSKKKVSVLKISDYNTKGIMGPCEHGTPYFAFMKASGESVKSSDIAGGSFGIGKNAPYAVSELRTLFVSTAFKNSKGEVEQFFQAKSILMSHKHKRKTHRGQGYWGNTKDCMPISDSSEVPEWLRRPIAEDGSVELGTSLYVLGFTKPKNWEERLTSSIVSNFFGAITEGKLEVEING